jgi:hypothetical protein
MLAEFLDLEAWAQWFAALDRQFIFLLALPFVVAIIGLWSWFAESEQEGQQPEALAPQSATQPRPERERRVRARRRGDARAAHQS